MAWTGEKITTQKKPLSKLLRDVDMGRFAIPKLQREFIWDGSKAAKLLDSIYRGMPIGVILIWGTQKSKKLYLRQRYHILPPFNDKNPKVWFLIDGQQRVSVLHWMKKGGIIQNARGRNIDFSRIVFSLEKEKDGELIRYRKPIPRKYLPLYDVLHPEWRFKLGHLGKSRRAKVQECREKILKYPIYFMFIDMDINEVEECFRRINTQGMKISTADAIIARAKGIDLRDFVHEVKQHLDGTFRGIAEMPIFWALAAVYGRLEPGGTAIEQVVRDIEKKAKRNNSERKALAKKWTKLSRCFGKAVDYLRENFKVLNKEFLYSDYLVSMLALFYFWNGHGPSHKQKEEIRKWFWATTVGSRYSGINFYRCVPEDAAFFKMIVQKPNKRFLISRQIDKTDIRKTQYNRHSGLGSAFYCLLLLHQPVSIMDEGINPIPIDRYATPANRKDRHHIFPRRLLSGLELEPNQYNGICNICLLTAEENQAIGFRRPWSYLGDVSRRKGLFNKKMKKHLIPVDSSSGIWEHDIAKGFKRFVRKREEFISKSLEVEAGIRLFRRDT